MKTLFLSTATFAASAVSALAGGAVNPPVIDTPAVAIATSPDSRWLIAAAAVGLLFLLKNGDRSTLPPGEHGGPCFREGTLIWDAGTPIPIESFKAGDVIMTSKGRQEILSIESWVPTEYKDRPSIVHGVHLSANHGVKYLENRIPACMFGSRTGMIDGARYYHILVRNHAWLTVEDRGVQIPFDAETLQVTKDLKTIRDRFPDLAEHHALHPCYKKVVAA